MPGELPPDLLGDEGSAETGTRRDDAGPDVASATATSAHGDADAKGGGATRPGFRFGPTPKPVAAEQHPVANAQSQTRTTVIEADARPAAARHSFNFNSPTTPATPNPKSGQAGDRTVVRVQAEGSAQTHNSDGFEMPTAFESDDLDTSEMVADPASTRGARFVARVSSRDNASGDKSSVGEGGDELCGIPRSAFAGHPGDLPIGTAYSRAVWARASRQAGQDNAVVEIRTAHGGSALVFAPRHQSVDTHGSNLTPWTDIDRALLIEVRHRSHAEQGYRSVKVGTGGFHKELGTVDVERPDLSALRRELGGVTDRVLYATVQISANPLSEEANGQVEREFWVVLPEDTVRRLATRGTRQQAEPRHRSLGIWNNGILSRDSGGRPELRLADANEGMLALPPVQAPDPEAGSELAARWTEVEGDFVVDTVERLLAGGMPAIQAEETGIWALYEHRRLKLGLPESARLPFLVDPSGTNGSAVVEPTPQIDPSEPIAENTDSQSNSDGDVVAAEPTKGPRFGFGARPRA